MSLSPLWSIHRDVDVPAPDFAKDDTIVADVDGGDATAWPAYQPGPLDVRHGCRDHTVRARFTVPGEPAADYVLRLEFDAGTGPCPDIVVSLGGHTGLVHPAVHRPRRDAVRGAGPIAGAATVEIGLPGRWLRPGVNEIDIATGLDGAVADDDPREFHRAYDGFGSGIRWHAASLRADALPLAEPTVTATPLFVRQDGELRELVDVTVPVAPDAPRPATVLLRLAGTDHRVEFDADGRDFGEFRARVAVAEFAGPAPAVVQVDGREFATTVRPARKWTMHLVPHVHLDIGYTDYQGKVLELHSRNLDRALDVQAAHPGFRFAADGSLIVGEFLRTRAPEQVERLLVALRDGLIGVNAFHSLFLSGLPSLEDCYRFGYLAGDLAAEHGVHVDYANLTDVPSYTSAIPSILAALGLRRFVGIENHGRGANADSDTAHLASPVWWRGPDGARALTYFSDQYSQLRHMVGDPQAMAGAEVAFTAFLAKYDRDDYAPSDIPIVGSHCDNEDLAAGDVSLVDRWNARYEYPRMRISTFSDYFDAVEPLGDALPDWRGDGGSYWEDGVGTAATAMVDYRRAQQLVPLAESLAALVALHNPLTRPNRAELDRGWDGLLVGAEHTWTWSHAYRQPHGEQTHDQEAWKRHRISGALRVGVDETRRAMSQLGENVTTDGRSVIVYNGLSWPRTLTVELDLFRSAGIGAADVAVEALSDEGGLVRLRLTVPDVPAFGYRVIPLRDGVPLPDVAPWRPLPAVLETDRWRVESDPYGRLVGLTHRATGRQLLDPDSPFALAEVVYAATTTERRHRDSTFETDPAFPAAEIALTAATMRPTGVRRTPSGWRLAATGSGPTLADVRVDVLLRDDSDTVEVLVAFDKERALDRESVYVAFPFAGDRPTVRWDRQQGWVDPAVDHSPGACNEWFTVQNAVCVDSADGGVVWTAADAPLFAVGDIVRGTWPTRFPGGSGTLLSWVMNNYWPTNTPPSQDGHVELRYAFSPTAGFDPVAAGRFGRAFRAPAGLSELTWLDKDDTGPRSLPAGSGALVDLDLPAHVAGTVFPARRADGVLVRVQNLGPQECLVPVTSPFGPGSSVLRCLADERPDSALSLDEDGRIEVELPPYGVVSLRFADS